MEFELNAFHCHALAMTSKPTAASQPKRQPPAPVVPVVKTPCSIHPTAVIADKAQITGPHSVDIGENVIIHPYAKIKADAGNVVIGKNSLVSEQAVVGGNGDVELGEGVDVQTGAQVAAKCIGEWSTIEVNAKVGELAVVGKHCKIAPLEEVKSGERLEDFTALFGDGQRRVDKTMQEHEEVRSAKMEAREKEIELLRRLIPNAAHKWI